MTEKELRDKIGIGERQLVNTNKGLMDILYIHDNKVFFGFLAFGSVQSEPIEEFLEKFTIS